MHECRHSHSRARIVDNKARHSEILVSLDSGLIYQHISESFEMRQEQVESVEDETNVSLSYSRSRLVSCCLDANVNQTEQRVCLIY